MIAYCRAHAPFTATAVELPMKRPLGASAKSIDKACLLLVDLLTQDGIEGHAYAFCYQPSIARSLMPIVAALSEQLADSPFFLSTSRTRLRGTLGFPV